MYMQVDILLLIKKNMCFTNLQKKYRKHEFWFGTNNIFMCAIIENIFCHSGFR